MKIFTITNGFITNSQLANNGKKAQTTCFTEESNSVITRTKKISVILNKIEFLISSSWESKSIFSEVFLKLKDNLEILEIAERERRGEGPESKIFEILTQLQGLNYNVLKASFTSNNFKKVYLLLMIDVLFRKVIDLTKGSISVEHSLNSEAQLQLALRLKLLISEPNKEVSNDSYNKGKASSVKSSQIILPYYKFLEKIKKKSKSDFKFIDINIGKMSIFAIQTHSNNFSERQVNATQFVEICLKYPSAIKDLNLLERANGSKRIFTKKTIDFTHCLTLLGYLFFFSLMARARALNLDLGNFGGGGIAITGAGISYNTGYSVSSAGDVNGDGKADMLIGAYGYSSNTGIVYLIYGGSNLANINLASLGISGITITGAGTNYQTGFSVSSAGDVNGDGKADMLIGAYGYSSGTGIVYLIYGGSNLANINLASLGSSGITITGAGTGYLTGYSVSSAGDVNGDGKADMLIGAWGTGIVYLIYGGSNLANINLASLGSSGITITGAGTGYFTDQSVSSAGDVNGDGKADMLIGVPEYFSEAGIVYLIYGASNLANINLASLGSSGIIITGAGANYYTGWSVSSAGEVNGDGKADMLIGAFGYSSYTGIVYLIYGGSNLANINLASLGSSGITITGAGTNYYTGYSVSSAGDVNGDGKADMLIGAFGYSSFTGIVYLIYGGSNLANINLASLGSSGITITGAGTNYYTGYSVSSAGDVNGDGRPDLLIGAPLYSSYTRKVYLVYGATSGVLTAAPISRPTSQPSRRPSSQPSKQPFKKPSGQPSARPSMPSNQPSLQPATNPSTQPSSIPSKQSSSQPTKQPAMKPSGQPSTQPLNNPSNQPSSQPSIKPSTQPLNQPSRLPIDLFI